MIKDLGLSDSITEDLQYFSSCNLSNKLNLPCSSSSSENILSIIVSHKIIASRVVDTMRGHSFEGYKSSGKGIALDIVFYEKILFKDGHSSRVNMVNYDFYNSTIIQMPSKIEGTFIDKLFNMNKLKANIHTHAVSLCNIDATSLLNNIYSTVYIKYYPTYELCYSTKDSFNNSKIFLAYNDGTNPLLKLQITFGEIIYLKWSPDGQAIAYLKSMNSHNILCLYNISKNINFSDSNENILLKDIKEFIWKDNFTIIYLYNNNINEDIYSLNIKTNKITQLTFTYNSASYESLVYNKHLNKLLFIKNIKEKRLLYEMNINGLEFKQSSSIEYIYDFVFSYDNRFIAVIVDSTKNSSITNLSDKKNDLVIIDLQTNIEAYFIEDLQYINIKKIISCNEHPKFIFIGSYGCKDDIFILNYDEKKIINITNNVDDISIDDIVCNTDGTVLYYTSNELGFYNIYSFNFMEMNRKHIVSTNAVHIKLDYRPTL